MSLRRKKPPHLSPVSRLMENLVDGWLADRSAGGKDDEWIEAREECRKALIRAGQLGTSVEMVAKVVAGLYAQLEQVPGPYQPGEAVPYMGELRPDEAELARRRRRESTRLHFRQELAKLMDEGCGIVCIHYATGLRGDHVSEDGDHPLLHWMGGYFATGGCKHHRSIARVCPATLVPEDNDHPILQAPIRPMANPYLR